MHDTRVPVIIYILYAYRARADGVNNAELAKIPYSTEENPSNVFCMNIINVNRVQLKYNIDGNTIGTIAQISAGYTVAYCAYVLYLYIAIIYTYNMYNMYIHNKYLYRSYIVNPCPVRIFHEFPFTWIFPYYSHVVIARLAWRFCRSHDTGTPYRRIFTILDILSILLYEHIGNPVLNSLFLTENTEIRLIKLSKFIFFKLIHRWLYINYRYVRLIS